MDPRTSRKLVERIQNLERDATTFRIGVITDDSPLSVAVGGSDVAYTNVKALGGPRLTLGDVVAIAMFGRDLLILGKIGDGSSGEEIGYDGIISPVTVSGTAIGAPTTILTAAAYDFDGGAVYAEFFSPNVTPGAGTFVDLYLMEGSTDIGILGEVSDPTDSAFFARYRFVPAAGSHTYKVVGVRGSANAIVGAGTGGTGQYVPCYLRFIKA